MSDFSGVSLKGKTAIVTGASRYTPMITLPSWAGAEYLSRGIGAGIAILLAKRGANVVVNYVSEGSAKRAQAVADEISKIGSKAIVCQSNVSNLDEIPRLVEAALKISETGKIEILIHKWVFIHMIWGEVTSLICSLWQCRTRPGGKPDGHHARDLCDAL
jgi:NAD(P)-dependent dehydrogenase (short-subunit alcohol dehydrogenase family)